MVGQIWCNNFEIAMSSPHRTISAKLYENERFERVRHRFGNDYGKC